MKVIRSVLESIILKIANVFEIDVGNQSANDLIKNENNKDPVQSIINAMKMVSKRSKGSIITAVIANQIVTKIFSLLEDANSGVLKYERQAVTNLS
jgi:hypothetical protein